MYPIMFTIPGIELPIYSYGVMLGLSLVVGWYLVMYLGEKDGLDPQKLASCFIWTAVFALLGSRMLYILTNLDEFSGAEVTDMFNVRKGGLVAYGGFLGGFLGSWLYLRRQRIRLLSWADVVVPTLGSGLGITRIGCFLYGCDYGKPIPDTAPAWLKALGLQFPNWQTKFPELTAGFEQHSGCMSGPFSGAPAYWHHRALELIGSGDSHSLLVYPTQLLEVVNGWIAFGLTLAVRRRTRFRGQAFLFFTAYYGLTRTLMEILRGDTQRGGLGLLSTSQMFGIATFLAAALAWYILARRAKQDPKRAMSLGPGADRSEDQPPDGSPQAQVRKKKRKK